MVYFFRHTFPYVAAVALATGALAGCAGQVQSETTEQDRVAQVVDSRFESLLDEIDATDQQRDELNDLKDQVFAKLKETRQDREKTRKQLAEQWLRDKPDEQLVHRLVQKRIDGASRFARTVTDAILQAHEVLTPAQRRLVAKKVAEHRHRFHGE